MKAGRCGPGVLGIFPVIYDELGNEVPAGSGKAGNICIRNPWPASSSDDYHTAMVLHHLGLLALEADGANDEAWSLNEQSLALFRQLGNRRLSDNVLTAMGRVARARGDAAEARASLVEVLISHRDVGDVEQMPHVMYTLAALDADAARLEDAVRLAAAAAKIRGEPWLASVAGDCPRARCVAGTSPARVGGRELHPRLGERAGDDARAGSGLRT